MNNPPRRSTLTAALGTLLLLTAGILALFYLLKLRFDAGDAMPRGSTLRSDPLGMEVLFESLNLCGVVQAERNYQSLQHCDLSSYDMLVISHGTLPMRSPGMDAMHSFVTNQGGRLLLTLAPQARRSDRPAPPAKSAGKTVVAEEPVEDQDAAAEPAENQDGAAEQEREECADGGCAGGGVIASNLIWYAVELCPLKGNPEFAELNPDYAAQGSELPQRLPVKTVQGLSTNILAHGWRAVYQCGEIPMVAEKDFGRGRVIISALSFPFSNEAMRSQRATGFLLWVFQGCPRVLFDESHFGLVISRTIAKLIRKNNLHYALLALLLPALLYFWLAAVPLIPRYAGDAVAKNEKGGESASALCSLLMRSVPMREIVAAALEGWRRSNSRRLKNLPEGLLDELIDRNRRRARRLPREREIVAAYNEAVDLLKEKD